MGFLLTHRAEIIHAGLAVQTTVTKVPPSKVLMLFLVDVSQLESAHLSPAGTDASVGHVATETQVMKKV